MSKPKTLTREEYEAKVLKHIEAIRKLKDRFNPLADHISIAICKEYEWAITFLPDDGKRTHKISDILRKHTGSEGIGPYTESRELHDEQ